MDLNNSVNDNGRNFSEPKRGIKKYMKKPAAKRGVVVQRAGGVDRAFLVTVILLLCLGTIMVFSASYPYANANFEGDSYRFARRQIGFALGGLLLMALTARTGLGNYHFLRRFSKVALVGSIILLAGVFVFGSKLSGATRWYVIGPISLQPSEIVKFTIVLFFADYADKYADKIRQTGKIKNVFTVVLPFMLIVAIGVVMIFVFENIIVGAVFAIAILSLAVVFMIMQRMRERTPAFYYGILPYMVVLGIVGILMFKQPHMSGLIIMCCITFAMMFMGGTDWRYLVTGGGVGAAAMFALIMARGYSESRILVWKNPFEHLRDGGWQPAQSLYAIGSGEFWGAGLGNSRQKHLYLPEPQNDYIFSIWCEEMGFIGAIILVGIFMFFIYRGILIGLKAPDRFSSLLVIGIIMRVGVQIVLNIAVVTNTLPSTGISLPFFSYGGTSLVILMFEMGVVMSVSRYSSI